MDAWSMSTDRTSAARIVVFDQRVKATSALISKNAFHE
jgi:hypothetical protein